MKKEKQSIKSTLRTLIRINHILKNASIKLYLISFLSSIFLGICTPINVNLKMYSFDHLRMYNFDHIDTCCSRW